jgi:membrane associated rhomboid family serine protease
MTEFRPSRFEILPTIIKNLLIINVLFFLGQQVFTEGSLFNMVDVLALHHVKSPLFQPWQIISHMFLHGGLWHLFGNMFALWMFGSILENLWGPKRFLTFYFLCGIGAAIIHLGFLWYDYADLINAFVAIRENPSPGNIIPFFHEHGLTRLSGASEALSYYSAHPGDVALQNRLTALVTEFTYDKVSTPTLGASGAVFGVLAAFIYLFPNTYIYLYFFVPVKAKWLGLVYFGYEIYMALQNSAGDNIARWAHIGGGLVGFLLVLTWNKKKRRKFY